MKELTRKAIYAARDSELAFCRFIVANDTGATGSHQSGFYIPKKSFRIFFDSKGERGTNKDRSIKIKWQDDFETDSRVIYYGRGTRNEYRLTRFGKEFQFLEDEYIGSLLVIVKQGGDYYQAFVLSEEVDIDDFLNAFGMTPVDTNNIITDNIKGFAGDVDSLIDSYICKLQGAFPDTMDIAQEARKICSKNKDVIYENIIQTPDKSILKWLNREYELFQQIEMAYYSDRLRNPFKTIDEFISTASSMLNRRKSRAGKSLEHHLHEVFDINLLKFSHPGKTEDNHKPDFIFPGNKEYHNKEYRASHLVFLGAKTTCKDRWRQILNETSRINTKHLFTLQQGISRNQLGEMYGNNIVLVVPKEYITTYPPEYRDRILTLKGFIDYAKEKNT